MTWDPSRDEVVSEWFVGDQDSNPTSETESLSRDEVGTGPAIVDTIPAGTFGDVEALDGGGVVVTDGEHDLPLSRRGGQMLLDLLAAARERLA